MSKEDSYIFGDYNSESGRMISILLEKCHDKPYCKTDEEIIDHYKGSIFMLLNNQIRFDSKFFGANSIIQESIVTFIPISTQVQQNNVFEV